MTGHLCEGCGGIFSDIDVLKTHVCPDKEPYISLDDMQMAAPALPSSIDREGIVSVQGFPFGIDTMDVVSTLTDLVADLTSGRAIPQRIKSSVVSEQGDFEMRTLTVMYAEKKPS